MDDRLYNKKLECPVCSNKIEVTQVKKMGYRIASRDTDFCVYYEGINPILYEPWVCEFCGYAALEEDFEGISEKGKDIIKKNVTPHWRARSFTGERDYQKAIEAYKLVIVSSKYLQAKSSTLAKISMRMAWIYRLENDPKEMDYLAFALKYYADAYEKESFPIAKMDESTCMYMIGELNRRLGNIDEAVKWFSKVLNSPEARKKPTLIESTREQYQLIKEELNKTRSQT